MRTPVIILAALLVSSTVWAAKFEPPAGRVLHGGGQTRKGFEAYWGLLPAENKPLLYLAYTNLDTGLVQLQRDLDHYLYRFPDCIPVIGVSWCWDLHPEHHQDGAIAAGEKDAGIRKLAVILKEHGRPVFVCPGYEFNGTSWNGYQPETFREAWKRFARILREEGAHNAALVWTASAMGNPEYAGFYPGDDWVDWWGINALEEQAFDKPWVKDFLAGAAKRKKPVMICEASAIFAGTKGGKISWNRWFKRFFAAIEKHPQIKAFAYINDDWSAPDAALPQLASWGDCRIQADPYVAAEYRKEMAKPRYVHSAPPARLRALLSGVEPYISDAPDPAAPRLAAKNAPAFELADPGTERVVDYDKYGVFENPGTFEYRYLIKDRDGLARASGEGIDPNRKIAADPRYASAKDEGRIGKDVWKHRPHLSGDPEADFFAWATSGEDFGVRLLNTGIALEEGGHFEHALKAYRAAMVLYPKSYGWSSHKKRWTWLVAPVAWGRIVNLTQRHPELGLKLAGTKLKFQIRVEGDWTKNRVALEPGKFVETTPEERAAKQRDPEELKATERRGGKVAVVRYENGHWGFEVEGRPYLVRGVTYTPTRVGRHVNDWNWMTGDENKNGLIDGPLESWVDANRNGKQDRDEPVVGDFKLLQEMGCNTIRWIHEHPLNLDLLREMHRKYGIRVALCEPFGAYVIHSGATWEEGTDYTNPAHRKNLLDAVRRLAEQVKDEPWFLCYILGNENNMAGAASSEVNATRTNAFERPEAYASLLNEAAKLIHEIDPDHPVGVGNLGWGLLDVYAEHAPELDFVGVNEYVGWHGFGALFTYVRQTFDRPVLVTEYGCDAYWTGKGPDEQWQQRYHRGCWSDIEMNRAGGLGQGNCVGGIAFEFLDEWWKDNAEAALIDGKLVDPKIAVQTHHPTVEMAFPDDWSQEEWFGIVGQGDGSASPFLRQPRKAYYLYRDELWKKWRETALRD